LAVVEEENPPLLHRNNTDSVSSAPWKDISLWYAPFSCHWPALADTHPKVPDRWMKQKDTPEEAFNLLELWPDW